MVQKSSNGACNQSRIHPGIGVVIGELFKGVPGCSKYVVLLGRKIYDCMNTFTENNLTTFLHLFNSVI